jgi:hypothetical protein
MVIASHSRHHNTFPTAYGTQSITATKNMKAAPKAAAQLFLKQKKDKLSA